jgi:hypothetical protein
MLLTVVRIEAPDTEEEASGFAATTPHGGGRFEIHVFGIFSEMNPSIHHLGESNTWSLFVSGGGDDHLRLSNVFIIVVEDSMCRSTEQVQ